MDVVADLHVHTPVSDGRLSLSALPGAARRAGVEVVAVTDHDRLHPGLDAPVIVRDGVTMIRGIELQVETATGRIDLLGYGAAETVALRAELDRLQRDRMCRARRMSERIEDRLGVELDVSFEPGVGRPHVARAVAESDAACDYAGAFDRLIGDDGPCYVPREVPSVERGIDLLSDACPVVSLAHPFRYADPDAALELAPELDAVERYYPYDAPVDTDRLDAVIEAHDLLATGGSDAHDRRLGVAGLDAAAYARFASYLPDAQG
ncbi:PHP domain-containing protein [Haloplanus pelagicus]|jgi:predicted metal-dependent phosphoesterase TrpH|uniref:PHP domain-containing protein n=1 Tax=Haloplanus pelagicus TaxID=2949995 RepID=UPI0020425156|nr:PHP domain-containing protein [Haloplanus sp. HW8-1]